MRFSTPRRGSKGNNANTKAPANQVAPRERQQEWPTHDNREDALRRQSDSIWGAYDEARAQVFEGIAVLARAYYTPRWVFVVRTGCYIDGSVGYIYIAEMLSEYDGEPTYDFREIDEEEFHYLTDEFDPLVLLPRAKKERDSFILVDRGDVSSIESN